MLLCVVARRLTVEAQAWLIVEQQSCLRADRDALGHGLDQQGRPMIATRQRQLATQRQQLGAGALQAQARLFLAGSAGAGQAQLQVVNGQRVRQPGGPAAQLRSARRSVRCRRRGGGRRLPVQFELGDLQRLRGQAAQQAGQTQRNAFSVQREPAPATRLLGIAQALQRQSVARECQTLPVQGFDALRPSQLLPAMLGIDECRADHQQQAQ